MTGVAKLTTFRNMTHLIPPPDTNYIQRENGMSAWRIDSVIDGRKLRTQLQATAMNDIHDRKAMRVRGLDLLHGALFRGRMIALERLEGGADGLDTARLLAAVQNEVLAALFDFVVNYIYGEETRTQGERLAVLAVGGYGRNVLAPSSDIDLLFLRNYKQTPWAETVIEYMLYMLWDMGLKVGHAFRTVDECIRMARDDLNTKTALLDARFMFGDEEIANNLIRRYHNEIVRGHETDFITAKLAERDKRHIKQGDTRFLVEPNVKEGKGGLRDLQTLFWLVKFTHGGQSLDDILNQSEVFTKDEARIFQRAARFLWTVRSFIHYLTGRPEERLSFDLQPEIAKRMGFEDEGNRLGVERFMKQYFLETMAVGSLTRILCAKLEASHQKAKGSLFDLFPLKLGQKVSQPGFRIEAGRLSIDESDFFLQNPVEMVRLFVLAEELKVDIHPNALSAMTRALTSFSSTQRENPEAIRMFLHLLVDTSDPGPILRLMNEAGLLGQIVPEFGGIVAQTQFNMYHHYTVDEHTLRAVDAIAQIERGECDWFPFGCEVFPKIRNRRALYLAMLLHDTGKGLGDQQIEGAITARRACLRLGLNETEAELVSWLVGNHLEMSDFAQKRDTSDPRTISQFVELVGSMERLNLLLILTVADIRAVGPDVWNGWKGQLLKELYSASADAFRSDHREEEQVAVDFDRRAEEARQHMIAKHGELPALMAQMDNSYWSGQLESDLSWQVGVLRNNQNETIAECRVRQDVDSVELMVAARDRIGLFADIVGAISDEGATIVSAQIFTGKNGGALDIFILKEYDGRMFGGGEANRLERLIRLVEKAVTEGHQPKETRKRRTGREAVFVVDPDVIVDNQGSAEYSIVEVTGKERPGLLHDLARAMSSRDIRLNSAHAGAYGERIQDIFYVQTSAGEKLTDSELLESLACDLLDILSRETDAAPRTPARVLAQARSAESF